MSRTSRLSAAVLTALLAVLLSLVVAPASSATPPGGHHDGGRPGADPAEDLLVIGHRGASGYRPEHTLASYELAARMGADYIECDVVSTADAVLVCRHENEISGTTDVADRPEFADRQTTKTVDGVELTGWFTEDFTLAELETLRAVERLPELREENTLYDGLFAVPTLDEFLELREDLSRELDREIGAYIETKHPTYFDGIGLSLEEPLLADLREARLDRRNSPVFLQSFETTNLRELDAAGVKVPLVQLLSASGAPADLVAAGQPYTYADLSTAVGLAVISRYADGVGPEKSQVIPVEEDGTLGEPTSFVADAHAVDLLVHPYTFRNENEFLPAELDEGTDPAAYGRALEEQLAFWAAGVDGIFTDNPDTGVLTRELFLDEDEELAPAA
ncbi:MULTISPECIES: glycerophosphodiester phosphodiesterase [unclassified Modestobacter]|uniref:glycerophosphodiester phosphodiesterase n=1 Tax=unclassified Modestobacter TaxID=2643866 RepID=UPI0022AADE33|nr:MULTISPECIES: glycerophosphodiester phosphodiesterase [unclassified Modestobacter]MCZ2824264.1 glycerophosphodiester phosphodiesterase [Modestobacter sp. VKM Ac-2981]MCZ2854208.1 glycerophosphodiester phosphodiesterase [Modestobacter sp. VKM Ac-2982]